MSHFLKTLSFAALVALSGPAFAQDNETADTSEEQEAGDTSQAQDTGEAPAPDAAGDLNIGAAAEGETAEAATPEDGPGSTYTAEEFGDWQQRCARAAEGNDPCQLYQLLQDADGNSVAEISIFPLPEGNEAAAGATVVTPLETLLPAGITITVDSGEGRRYPFEFCAPQGCIARIGFTQAEVEQFKRGAAGELVIRPAAAPDQEIELTISLSGFTAGYDAVQGPAASE